MQNNPAPKPRTGGIVAFIVVGFLALVIIGAALSSVADDDAASGEPLVSTEHTRLQLAKEFCSAGELSDGDRTLVVDTEGEEYGSGVSTFEDLGCILGQVSTPDAVIARMEATRALDGMQSESWDGFEASWTYHPDDGLDIIITES